VTHHICFRIRSSVLALTTLLVGLQSLQAADIYEPPTTYYSSITNQTGSALQTQLRTIISSATARNYGAAQTTAAVTDTDPNNPNNVLLIYNRASVSSTWDSGATWNREHIWPVSRLGVGDPSNSTTNISTDQFNLRPSNPSINSSRGNKPFGNDSTTGAHGSQGANYYPGDADAGDVARAQFYMATRYSQLTLTDAVPSGTQMGDLSSLINYHFKDVPDAFERRRNHAIYGLAGENSPAITNSLRQQNRNPFVDHPEYAWSIFVDQQNDSQLSIAGGTPMGNGGSTRDVNLGSVLVGAAVPAAQSFTLNKAGLDGTYYDISTTGSATSSVTGRLNAFANGVTGTKALNVGLATNTASAGLRSGAVTIDNLDVTTQAGAGMGANDADDVFNVSLSVLDHANASFVGGSDLNSLTLDFGSLAVGGGTQFLPFDVFNLMSTVGFTAPLDLVSFVGSGDTSTLGANLSLVNNLAASAGQGFLASFDTASTGSFAASYQLSLSDDTTLAGAVGGQQLTLNLLGNVVAVPEPAGWFLAMFAISRLGRCRKYVPR
jgi:endonuclease I